MAPPDLADLGPRLRAHADILRDLRDENLAVLRPDAVEALTLLALASDQMADAADGSLGGEAEERRAEAVRLALLRRQDAARACGVLRLMARPAPVPVVPRPAAEVIQFPRGVA